MFSQFSPAFISTMRSTLDIDPPFIARIGLLGVTAPSGVEGSLKRFRAGLRDSRVRRYLSDFRWAERNYARLAKFAAELIRLRIDVLVTYGTPGTLAAKQATATPVYYDTWRCGSV